MFGEPEQQDLNRSVFSCGRVVHSGSTKSISYFHTIRRLIFSKDQTKSIECPNAAAIWARHSAGLESVGIVPQASFDYVLSPFIAVSKSEFAIVGRAGR